MIRTGILLVVWNYCHWLDIARICPPTLWWKAIKRLNYFEICRSVRSSPPYLYVWYDECLGLSEMAERHTAATKKTMKILAYQWKSFNMSVSSHFSCLTVISISGLSLEHWYADMVGEASISLTLAHAAAGTVNCCETINQYFSHAEPYFQVQHSLIPRSCCYRSPLLGWMYSVSSAWFRVRAVCRNQQTVLLPICPKSGLKSVWLALER